MPSGPRLRAESGVIGDPKASTADVRSVSRRLPVLRELAALDSDQGNLMRGGTTSPNRPGRLWRRHGLNRDSYRRVSRQPAAWASSTEQNQRVPLLIFIWILAYQRLAGV